MKEGDKLEPCASGFAVDTYDSHGLLHVIAGLEVNHVVAT